MALSAAVADIGVPVLAGMLSATLKKMDNALAQKAGKALENVENLLSGDGVSAEEIEEANRHMEVLAELKSREIQNNLSEINQSLRQEVSSDDVYVRRMRPTFGYLMAFSWTAQMFALAYVIVFQTGQAGIVLQAMESLGTIWAVGLSVLGIYVYKRSEDKKLERGLESAGTLLSSVSSLFTRKAGITKDFKKEKTSYNP